MKEGSKKSTSCPKRKWGDLSYSKSDACKISRGQIVTLSIYQITQFINNYNMLL